MQRFKIGSGYLFIRQGDITTLEVDCIVNAANSRLAGGGGVDGAIHRAAGAEKLQEACQAIIANISSLPSGEAVITPGFNLPAKHIIHTVGPIWRGGKNNEPELFRNAYLNSLKLAREHTIKTIAFPGHFLRCLRLSGRRRGANCALRPEKGAGIGIGGRSGHGSAR